MAKFNTDEFRRLEAHWYQRLAEETGFQDIEAIGVDGFEDGRPLKQWTGSFSHLFDAPGSAFPERLFIKEERLLYHASFEGICVEMTQHGNYSLTAEQVANVWEAHIDGETLRAIGERLNVNFTAVFRTIKKLEAYADLMGEEEDTPVPDSAALKIRTYSPKSDNPLIFSTWRNILWFDEKRDERQAESFFRKATQAIKELLAAPDCSVRIGCLEDDPNLIIGYAVFHGSNLTWAYVKADYREKGVGSFLTAGFSTISAPMTKIGKSIARTHKLRITKDSA